jgi:hypothetical protein
MKCKVYLNLDMNYHNPKALNLEDLPYRNSKVTLGFKCDPLLKLKLAKEAAINGLTLSTYTEKLINEHIEKIDEENQEIEILKSKIVNLSKRLRFYESPILEKLLAEHKHEEHIFTGIDGKKVKLRLTTIQDVFTLMINNYK